MIEFLREVLSNVQKSNKEKMEMPIFATFIISFLLHWVWIYWKPISIFMLSEEKIIERIGLIDGQINIIHEKISYPYLNMLLFAVVMTLVYTIAMPYAQSLINRVVFKIQKENFITQATINLESRKIQIENELSIQEHRALISKNQTYDGLIAQLTDKDRQISEISAQLKKVIDDKNEELMEYKNIYEGQLQTLMGVLRQKEEQLESYIDKAKQYELDIRGKLPKVKVNENLFR